MLQVSTDDAQAYADENGLVYWETSAKTNANVSELFDDIAKRCARCCRSSSVVTMRNPILLCCQQGC
jgi:Ras family